MYPYLGNPEMLESKRRKNCTHCSWLRRDPNACEALPVSDDYPADKVGKPCPHNAYANHPQVFENRDGVSGTIEHLMRLVNSAEIGVVSESDLDPLTLTELITARLELDRIHGEKQKREYARARYEAQANQGLPSWGK